jgi:uncharacterized damage-inducible protein DinB
MNTIQFIADCLAQTHIRLMATCDGLKAEQMAWRPAPTANNIGFILWHLTRNEDGRISRTAGRQGDFEQDLWVTGGWFERFGQPETAPDPGDRLGLRSLAIPAPDVLISYAEAVSSRSGRFLELLDDSRLNEHMGDAEPRQTLGGSLRHVIVHKNNHHGQIDYLRGLLEEDWDLTPGTGGILPGRST